MKAGKFISDTLKKVINAKNHAMIIAKTTPISLAFALEKLLKTQRAITIQIAIKNIWSIEIVNQKIDMVKPEKKPFLIFCGNNTFINQ